MANGEAGETGVHSDPFHSLLADRKSTRLNSSHLVISYAVFCLKKKTNADLTTPSAALSRSAFEVTIAGFLLPISAMNGFGYGCFMTKYLYSCMPTSLEPLHAIPATIGLLANSAPKELPGPVT